LHADRKNTEKYFEVGYLVFVRRNWWDIWSLVFGLCYKKSTLKRSGAENLKPRFYGPYKVVRKVGEIAYELELPPNRKIDNVFHVSCLKKVLG